MMMELDVDLFIAGVWRGARQGRFLPIMDPATGEETGRVAHADTTDLDEALAAAASAFRTWQRTPVIDRATIMRRAAAILRERVDVIAPMMTCEQGKPLSQSRQEILSAGDLIEWFAEEGRRSFGQVIPSRAPGVTQIAMPEPIGPVAAFTPWNFPINQAVRKISAALAAGCSMILKGPEETPASCAELVRAFADAELPAGVLNLVFGTPSEISAHLVPHPVIRKISFTGSTVVGKHLAALAGAHMKPVTMELGGHAPVLVFKDCDLPRAVSVLTGAKYRNAGQVCVSPTRFLVEQDIYPEFVDRFVAATKAVRVGNGLDPETEMGPLANARRVAAVEELVTEAVKVGAKLKTGGERIGNSGYFFQPTVLADVPLEARIMNEEPFGPVAAIRPFATIDEAITEANRLPYGLSAYAYTRSSGIADRLGAEIESGMLSVNHHGLGLPEVPFGGIKDSGYGTEGGVDAITYYQTTKFVTRLGV
jgi:succinate-semialdehyde dehydrogenase/glutarate-semialdehyde dehydrogenase